MAKEKENPNEDEDDISAAIADAFKELDDTPPEKDDGGFDIPMDADTAPKREQVSEEDGHKQVEEAQDKANAEDREPVKIKEKDTKTDEDDAEKKPEAKAEPKTDEKPDAESDEKTETKAEEAKADAQVELADDATFEAAVADLDPKVKARIDAVTKERDEILAPLTARSQQLDALGVKPKDAVDYFLKMNDYANRDPGEYAAYALGQISRGDSAKLQEYLAKAAELHGFKLTKAEDTDDDEDDDPFIDDELKQLRKEKKQWEAEKAGNSQKIMGPDNPKIQAQTMIEEFIGESDGDGNLLHPDLQTLMPMITPVIQQIAQTSGRAITKKELQDAYEAAERLHPATREKAAARQSQKSAAQGGSDVKEQVTKDAAAAAKAKAASSKIIEGSGQGAKPQPANDASGDESVEAFLDRILPQKM